MTDTPHFTFESLPGADLLIDTTYEGGKSGTSADDPLARLLPVGNQGGFRYAGSSRSGTVRLVALYSTGSEVDWPDSLDPQTGAFVYYGDNRRPGRALHDTARGGNLLLRRAFDAVHADSDARRRVPPFLLFEKVGESGRKISFRGLLAPGGQSLSSDEDLVAIWRSSRGERFQNYRAIFTVLDVPRVTREWINELLAGESLGPACPTAWHRWVTVRRYEPLAAPPTTVSRQPQEQLPTDSQGRAILQQIRDFFRGREADFESCAVEIWRMLAPATGRCDVTRPSRDGGRDATGEYLLGPPADRVRVEFALEAKCYDKGAVGVREVSRLVSRIRHRQFGVFVTTSYFNRQVYSEVRDDGHPIALVCGRDIVEVLRTEGYADEESVSRWLHATFKSSN